jgi:glutathione S-transferase
MKLYTFDPAPNPKRLADFLSYKGIEIETTQIDMMGGEQLGEDYLKINPAGTVPALVLDDGTVLTEVIGICCYLEALYPEKPLLGTTALEKGLVISWCHKLFGMIMMAVADALRNRSPNFANRALPGPLDVPQIEALADRGKLRLNYAWPEMEKALAGLDWLVGERITLADIDLATSVSFAGWVKSAPGEDFPNILAHSARVQAALEQS